VVLRVVVREMKVKKESLVLPAGETHATIAVVVVARAVRVVRMERKLSLVLAAATTGVVLAVATMSEKMVLLVMMLPALVHHVVAAVLTMAPYQLSTWVTYHVDCVSVNLNTSFVSRMSTHCV